MLRRMRESLGGRLFLWLFGSVLAGLAAYALFAIWATSNHSQTLIYEGALRGTEVIKQATRHAMLLNRKDDVHEIISSVARLPGVAGVRLYDKRGRIISSGNRDEIGREVDLHDEACVACHDSELPPRALRTSDRARVYRAAGGERVLGLITPVENEPECTGCHVHRTGQTVLGVLDVQMSLAEADAHIAAVRRQLLAVTLLAAAGIGAVSAAFIDRVVRRPVRRLTEGARRIAAGDLGTRVAVASRDEVGELAVAFNTMTSRLEEAQQEISVWSETLEQKVVERTDELHRAERQLVQMEKMASLGKLASTVAHELNNPLAGILTYAKLVEREIAESDLDKPRLEKLTRYLRLVQKESSRCGHIVHDLLSFSRTSRFHLGSHALNAILERSMLLVEPSARSAGIRFRYAPLDGDDRIHCDEEKLQQALLALLVNAIEAMPDGGTLDLAAEPARHGTEDAVRIIVADSGVGIPNDVIAHIFEPFFSTKEEASGVGLGLAVVYGIVEQHRGRIEVTSRPGAGTTFQIVLPRHTEPRATSEIAEGDEPQTKEGGMT